MKKVMVYLHKNNESISYGELWKAFKSEERKSLTPLEKAHIIVNQLNELLPSICLKQRTMYYFVREE